MLARIRIIAGGAVLLFALAACGGATTLPADTVVPSTAQTAAPVEGTAYPAPTISAPADVTAYPGTDNTAPLDVPPAYPGATTTP